VPFDAPAPVFGVGEIFRRFWPQARRYRVHIALSMVLVGLVPLTESGAIWVFKLLVDQVLVPREFGPFWWIALALLGLSALDGAVSFGASYLTTWVGERFLLELRTKLFSHLHELSLDFFDRRRLGDLMSRLTGDVGAIESFVISGLTDGAQYTMRVAFFAVALFVLQWQLALLSLAVAPVFWVFSRHFSRRIKEVSREKRRRSGSLSAVAEESLASVGLVQAYNGQEREVARFHAEGVGAYEAELTATRLRGLYSPLVDLVEWLGVLMVIGIGTWELSQGRMSLGSLLAFMAFLVQLYGPIRSLARLVNRLHAASAGAERIIELLDVRPTIRERRSARRLERAAGEVELRRVSFRYPESPRLALLDVSARVEPGQTLAIVGASGAGKSTLARLLLRFYDPLAGAIALDAVDLRDLRVRDLRANVALVLQETLVFDGTIRENILFGRPGASPGELAAAVRAADLDEALELLPDGLDTRVGQKGRRLSGGQRQRIAIARAMIRDAPVLLLDEPTTGLDAESSRRIVDPLRRLMDGRTTIVISHNLLTVRHADSILVLDRGTVAEHGPHDDLMAADGIYARLYRLHQPEELVAGRAR
jgi:ABC-type multidrug transport system fused ATPase/permease subunit